MIDSNTILIADDHELIRNGLAQILASGTHYAVVQASNGDEALKKVRELRPVLAVLDIEMPLLSGFDVARRIHDEKLPVSVIFLTMFKDEVLFNRAMDIGVKGYILKENTSVEIMTCVRTVLDGHYYLSPVLTDFLVRRNSRLMTPAADKEGMSLLTVTEKRIMKLLSELKTSHEIAAKLGVSVKTVQNHRNNICAKLELQGAHALLKYAIEHGSLF
jgi:DNA-binding NarL/FixJ family response regulator